MITKNAFTMIELIFVIVVLGILASVAIPKFAATRDDAHVAKARSTVSAVRSAIISERQSRLLRGDSQFISALDYQAGTIFDSNVSGGGQLLMYGVQTKDANGHWTKNTTNQYDIKIGGVTETFTYTPATGIFDCDHSNDLCKNLTE